MKILTIVLLSLVCVALRKWRQWYNERTRLLQLGVCPHCGDRWDIQGYQLFYCASRSQGCGRSFMKRASTVRKEKADRKAKIVQSKEIARVERLNKKLKEVGLV